MRAASAKLERVTEITARLAPGRFPSRHSDRFISTGLLEVNALFGGLPCGSITEVIGQPSSGRTSLLLSALAAATNEDETCALVDTTDCLDIAAANAAEIELDRLLWIRCSGNVEHAFKSVDLFLHGGGFGLVALRNLVGAGNVGAVELLDTHRPDAFRMKPFTVSSSRKRSKPQIEVKNAAPLLGFRRFRPPLLADVKTVAGRPTQVTVHTGAKKLSGTVVKLAGPWRAKGDWWRGDQGARDEWDISLRSSANEETLYRIFRELESETWYVEGVYD